GRDYAAIIATRAVPQPAPQPESQTMSASTPAIVGPNATATAKSPQSQQRPTATSPTGSSAADANPPRQRQPAFKPDMQAKELCALFFAAGSMERRLILISLEFLPTPPAELPVAMQQMDVWRFESAAL